MGNFEGYKGPPRIGDPALTWAGVDWLRANTRLPVLLKGIVTREDAQLAVRRKVAGLIVSNHGGRQEESGRGTLECLPEGLAAVDGRSPRDGWRIRRGTDVFKALALAPLPCASDVRPVWHGAYGDKGVAWVLAISTANSSARCSSPHDRCRGIKPVFVHRHPE